MKVPYTWLSEFLQLRDISPEEIARELTLKSAETEVETFGIDLDGVVVGKIVSVKPHPKRNELVVARVQVSEHIFVNVVSGDKTLKEGELVVVALPNSKVGDRCVTKREIDGVLSEGMLLSAQELGLEEKSEGVLRLDEDLKPGTDASFVLGFGEPILVLDITPNRGDLLSVRGVAREVSAIFGLPKNELQEPAYEDRGELEIEIRDEDCGRYRGALIEGVSVKRAPLGIRKRLWQCGIKSVNNVVDITNYVMLREGQPLHAFDAKKLKGGIVVRSAKKGERITTLDGSRKELDEDILVIADREKPVAIAGVIGGLDSAVSKDTTDILLESAYFNPYRIRKASKKLGLQTESSYRFERNVDIERVKKAQDYAIDLILKHTGGKLVSAKDLYPKPYEGRKIFLPQGKYIRYAGEPYKNEEASRILTALEIPHEVLRCGIEVFVPAHRSFDLFRDVDIVEELMRVKGYESFPSEVLRLPALAKEPRDPEREVRTYLRDRGLYEVINFSFEDGKLYELLGLELPKLQIVNPLNPTQRYLRTTLITALLRSAVYNDRNYNYEQGMFELGKVFFPEGEEKRLGLLLKGERWDEKELLGILGGVFELFGLKMGLRSGGEDFLHPYQRVELLLNGEVVGFAGRLHPKVVRALELRGEPWVAEIKVEKLFSKRREPVYRPFSKFPPVVRDIALVMDKHTSVDKLLNDIKSQLGEVLEELSVFDVYTGTKVGEGKKSVGIRLVFRSTEGSLKDEEVNELVNRLIEYLEKEHRVRLRT
ncbi:MAG: phenylalanine--tRNA ligase subunit beta [Aquificae bacterium]|nr:phenylalanine--tRNA ligase subunit beta [Aquificota bacterium]